MNLKHQKFKINPDVSYSETKSRKLTIKDGLIEQNGFSLIVAAVFVLTVLIMTLGNVLQS